VRIVRTQADGELLTAAGFHTRNGCGVELKLRDGRASDVASAARRASNVA